ncbi:hypothetical protein [Deinococcus soli (ex Cha et al. 2016)]|uniref:Uncharacterized protein n=2 Tax=Deinococcus soli (ex Cha et al. 2016) TaxID=1309411 RepID=A0AAE3XCQ7_9DEIO|nr:hypothetical protein [Deinococcus soli (ex Cha et al. 2016)]MDR6218534.1 hypothetical protein [Deinococcus soli (ex Cha et al. 2016)]MDR6329274.1 hypothetical protein [Deinococcus soli (ex Cha et al. 2016)]MDR6751547.1 hypothetical protein [Deinococcus soli (ex Cha et al. 2016)]
MTDLNRRVNARLMPRTRAEVALRDLNRLTARAPESFHLGGSVTDVEDGPWKSAFVEARARLDGALMAFGVQERCPAWWVLRHHVRFESDAVRSWREVMQGERLLFQALTPVVGLAPLRAVAAYSRQVTLSRRALPASASAGTPGAFMVLREVGVVRSNRYGPAVYMLDFSDPARPFRG